MGVGYQTAGKKWLLDFLQKNADTAFTIEEITARLDGEDAPGKSTLYRLLPKLVEAGLVKQFAKENSRQFVYQAVGCAHHDDHLHLKCTDCGKILHLTHKDTHSLVHSILQNSAFAVDEKQTVLFGRCAACQKEKL